MLEKIDVVHFSTAGNTRKAALLLAQAMAGRTEEYDLTRPHNTGRSFGPGDVVIVAGNPGKRGFCGDPGRIWKPCL